MKLPAILFFCGVVVMFNACERHPVSDLATIEAGESGHESATEGKSHEAASPEQKPESAPAPKLFPAEK